MRPHHAAPIHVIAATLSFCIGSVIWAASGSPAIPATASTPVTPVVVTQLSANGAPLIDSIVIDRFDVKVGENPLSHGWEGGHLKEKKLDFQYIWEQGNVFMRSRWLKNEDAEALKRVFEWDTRKYPVLRWRWRAQKIPQGAKIMENSKSDAVAQIYLLWKGFPTYYVMKYFWAATDPVTTLLEQSVPLIGRLRGLVVRSGGPVGVWHTEVRNVHEDFIRYFGGEPPGNVRGIAILSDADQTQTVSEADYDDIEALKSMP